MLGLNKDQVHMKIDPSLGKSCNLLDKISSNLDILEAALTLPSISAGEGVEFQSGLKANLPEMLAALRVARRNSGLARKMGTGGSSKSTTTTPEHIRKAFNTRFGFEISGADPWVCSVLRATFSEITKPDFEKFPGEWMHSLRVRNGSSSDAGIMAKLGFTAIQASPTKVKFILCNKPVKEIVHEEPKSSKRETRIGKGTDTERLLLRQLGHEKFKETNFQEFRALVTTLLPYIDPKSNKKVQEQLPSDPFRTVSPFALAFYQKNPQLVDAINLAFAIYRTVPDKKKKSDTSHFEQVRNHVISLTANVGFYDASGNKYERYTSIPENIRGYFESNFNHKIGQVQRSTQDNEKKTIIELRKENSSLQPTPIEAEGKFPTDVETSEEGGVADQATTQTSSSNNGKTSKGTDLNRTQEIRGKKNPPRMKK
jgi:hypothetical protein